MYTQLCISEAGEEVRAQMSYHLRNSSTEFAVHNEEPALSCSLKVCNNSKYGTQSCQRQATEYSRRANLFPRGTCPRLTTHSARATQRLSVARLCHRFVLYRIERNYCINARGFSCAVEQTIEQALEQWMQRSRDQAVKLCADRTC